jgi:RNA polymerase sigma factor (sigma-70 family)
LLQEGRIGLWQAILHFDPHRGVAFSTYCWVAIQRCIWRAVARASRPQGEPLPAEPVNLLEIAEERVWLDQTLSALAEAVFYLPDRLRQVVVAAYGLDGNPPRSLAAIGRRFGVSRERVRQLRNDALVLLRLPVFSGRLRLLCDQNTRAAYARTQTLNRAWLRQQRGRRQR